MPVGGGGAGVPAAGALDAGGAGDIVGAGGAAVVSRFAQYNATHDKKRMLKDRRDADPLVHRGDTAVKRAKHNWNQGLFNAAIKAPLPGVPIGLGTAPGTPVTAYSVHAGAWTHGSFRRLVCLRGRDVPDLVVVQVKDTVMATPVELVRNGHLQ